MSPRPEHLETSLWRWSELNRVSSLCHLAVGQGYSMEIRGRSPERDHLQVIRRAALGVLSKLHALEEPGREGFASGPAELRVLRALSALRQGDEGKARATLGLEEEGDLAGALRALASLILSAWADGGEIEPPSARDITPAMRIRQLEGGLSRAIAELERLRCAGHPVDQAELDFALERLGDAKLCPSCQKDVGDKSCGPIHGQLQLERGLPRAA